MTKLIGYQWAPKVNTTEKLIVLCMLTPHTKKTNEVDDATTNGEKGRPNQRQYSAHVLQN